MNDQRQTPRETPREGTEPATASVVTCDFCHQTVPSVRRVALDGEYERLRTPHQVMYACPTCFERKERRRMGLERG